MDLKQDEYMLLAYRPDADQPVIGLYRVLVDEYHRGSFQRIWSMNQLGLGEVLFPIDQIVVAEEGLFDCPPGNKILTGPPVALFSDGNLTKVVNAAYLDNLRAWDSRFLTVTQENLAKLHRRLVWGVQYRLKAA